MESSFWACGLSGCTNGWPLHVDNVQHVVNVIFATSKIKGPPGRAALSCLTSPLPPWTGRRWLFQQNRPQLGLDLGTLSSRGPFHLVFQMARNSWAIVSFQQNQDPPSLGTPYNRSKDHVGTSQIHPRKLIRQCSKMLICVGTFDSDPYSCQRILTL